MSVDSRDQKTAGFSEAGTRYRGELQTPDAPCTVTGKGIDPQALACNLRLAVLDMISGAGSSHIGSVFSCTDIISVLYARVLNVAPGETPHPDRDRFILSKGHAGAAVYVALAELGFLSRELLSTYGKNGSVLSGHVSHKGVPGVELSTGSLGHGLSVGCGMALSAQKRGKSHRTFVLMSDGECDEGSNWEAFLFAAHHKLENLTAVVDYNKLQSITSINETLALEPFADKMTAFGWTVLEADGHDYADLERKLTARKPAKPTFVLAHTTKGKGVSFMENAVLWHYRTPRDAEYEAARKELLDSKARLELS